MVVDEGYSNECLTCIMNDDIDTDTYMPLLHSKWHIFETIRKIDDLFKINDKYSYKISSNYNSFRRTEHIR